MSWLQNTAQPEKRDIFMKNGTERGDVLSDSRKRYRGQRQEYTDRVKNQSDFRIRYRALWKKKPSFPEGCRIRRKNIGQNAVTFIKYS